MLDTIAGLPAHTVIVHATVVTVPVAAAVVLLAALWPRFRRWAGLLPLGLALLAVVLVPLATQSGESLEERVSETGLVERHAEMGESLLPWVIALAVVAAALAWLSWEARGTSGGAGAVPNASWRGSRAVAVVLALAALVAAAGTTVEVIRIGHSGADAVWSSTVN